MTKRRERRERERGQSITELAIFIPILIVLLLGIGDLARAFATMIAIESSAREAADWGAYRPGNWATGVDPAVCDPDPIHICTVREMERRACTGALDLPDYVGAADGSTCTNPTFACAIGSSTNPTGSCSSASTCDVDPCHVKVTLTYDFSLIAPGGLLGLPASFTLDRSSTFAVGKDPEGTP